ncbi:hypothetical protein DL96DRAFT_1756989 [Flagelloscypha sp. PMI_526]|nr:hypothetical protein DL96DRAFT_1756989 [Flagelloscypha sp. PMI_526]
MVKEIMNRVEVDCQLSTPPRVCDYFDMICGSGFGGILAIMCGILKMTGQQLVHEFINLCKVVFAESLDITQRTAVLEQEMKAAIRKYSTEGEERKMICEDDPCKTFVCAAAFHNTGHPRLFRNYHSRANPSLDCMLWEAGCATVSMPDLFNPIFIGDTNIGETFVGGDLRWNNPTDELTREAADVFTGRRITCIISIGSGHTGYMSLSKGLADLFSRIALDCERVADDIERRFGNIPEVFWRLNVEQGLQSLAVDPSNLDVLASHTHSYLQSARTTRSINILLQDLIGRPERLPVDRISGMAPALLQVLRRKLCPPPSQHFTGRSSELKKLEEYFSLNRESRSCRVGVLYGIGGGGKSQMGLEFVRRSHGRFSDIFFVDATDKFTLENGLKTIALGVSDEPTVEDALHLLQTSREEWLLFLDNADDPSLDLRPYITWPHGNILITTRNREIRMHAPDCHVWVDKLELDDAVELLLRGVSVHTSPDTYQTASEIVQKLGCLALAVNQARGFLVQDICTLSEYLPIYMQNRKRLLEDRLIQSTDDYEHTVYTTWTISFNKLSSSAVQLLELLCFMHHESIPSRIFEDAWKTGRQVNEDAVPASLVTFLSSFEAIDSTWDILQFRMLIKEILSFSLIEFNASSHTFSLHPLVQQWAQSRYRHSQEVLRSTQTLLSLAVPRGETKEDYVMTLLLLPHVRASMQTGIDVHFTLLYPLGLTYDRAAFGLEHPVTLSSMNNLAITYGKLGQNREGLELQEQVLALRTQIHGEEHPDTLTSMGNLAVAYSKLGQHKHALKIKERVLELSTEILGKEHPSTVISMSNLARTYSSLGQYNDALELEVQVLALRTEILGNEHPDTLMAIGNLARTYSDLGCYRDALKLEEQVLALRTEILGKEHPDTLMSMKYLASTYSHLGQYGDALSLRQQVLVLRAQILGEKHLDTLKSMNDLASTYSNLGQYKDALQFEEQVLVLRMQILGNEHPDTLTSMNDIAVTYLHLGRHRDALNLNEQVLAVQKRSLGEDHPATLASTNNLASTYLNLGQYVDALKLQEQALASSTHVLGEEHPSTLEIMHNLAGTHYELGQRRDAMKLQERVIALRVQSLGKEHPHTLLTMNNLAITYSCLGQHGDAVKLREQVLAVRAEVLGNEHPDTVMSMINLAAAYLDLGQHKDALKLKQEVLKLSTRIRGEEHPDTLRIMNDLAVTYSNLGQHREALKLKERGLALRTQILGEEHPDTLISMNNLAVTYSECGQHEDALKLHGEVLRLETLILGEEHPHTLASMNNLAGAYLTLGQDVDALKLYEQTFNMRRRVLGPEHPDTIESSKWFEGLRNRVACGKGVRKQGKRDKLKRLMKFF